MSTPLAGCRVRRIDMPAVDLLALTLSGPNATLLLRAAPRALAMGLVANRPPAPPAQGFTTFLRKHVEGATLEALTPHRGGLSLVLRTDAHGYVLHLERTPNLVLERDGRTIGALHVKANEARGQKLGQPYEPPEGPPIELPEDPWAAGATLLGQSETEDEASARRRLARRAQGELERLGRRVEAIEKDLADARRGEQLFAEAHLLVSHAHELVGDTLWTTDAEGAEIAIPMNGATPFDAAERRFEEAKRLRGKAEVSLERRLDALRLEAELRAYLSALEDDDVPLERLKERLDELTPRKQPLPSKRDLPRREPYRTVLGTGDRPILVGKSARDNDALTTKTARPHDLWLHARGVAGSHVVVPLEKGETIPSQLLVDAATLAAHFSDARGQDKVEIVYADKRFVRKSKGSPAGQVILEREKTMLLRLEPERLARLLGQRR